ncbi:TonB-dependent receptor [Erythrobacter sp. THAF29]|uniref:TonB-dependent receptor n=1 Tax=Erythrobacter sp. THAF29 TaxID=2587851 RepID=UPI00126869D2|nr:TonB-dependent receptor [Erythrobacter sp. THAF29]QFT76664.1 putative TonB-dependent receptor precursor [Erythrobacter sp. THAF29]
MILFASRLALATGLAFAAAAPVFAQTADQAEGDAGKERVEDDLHSRQVDYQGNIIVSAAGLEQLDVLAGTSVFEAEDIQRNLNGQIGEVLAKLPGVSATSFAPGSSRPVLRGFQGERVRVLVDGIGTADVSNTSVDHATSIDPLTAERIEVLRGPAVLLYGSQAIGGAVNVIDKRIPTRIPDKGYHLDALIAGDTATDLRSGGASLDVPLGSNFVIHVDGTWRETSDLEIPGFQIAPALRAEILEEAAEEEAEGEFEEAEEFREAANQQGFVPNTASETWTVNGGFGLILGESTFGASIGLYDTNYGVPGRPGVEHAHEEGEDGEEEGEEEGEEIVTIDLEQFRADFKGDIYLGEGFFQRLKLRAGFSDYTHTEFEGDEVGTVFDSKSVEARAELVQNEGGVSRGAIGIQYRHRDFFAEGAEAYVPPNLTDQFSVFALQEFGTGPLQVELAGRFETTDVEDQLNRIARDFDTFSGAVGLIYEGDDAFRVGVNVSRAERAPSAEELFSNGPHIATQAFEIGDPDLSTESAWGVEGFVRGRVGGAQLSLAVFQQWFDDYIFITQNGLEEDGLPVFVYLQQDADYFGVEGDISFPLFDNGGFGVVADLSGSYVSAELGDGTSVPRIPPLSLLGGLEVQTNAFDVRGEVQWFAEQDQVAAFETPTDEFAFVNFLVSWRPLANNENITVQVAADNVFDVTGRRHASFTKDFVPLAGRNFRASVRFSF